MDDIDRNIIAQLERDGRKSCARIAVALHTTKATVARRIQALIASGLLSVCAKPDPLRIGWRQSAFVMVKAELARIDAVCEQIAQHLHASLVMTLFGVHNIAVVAICASHQQLHAFIDTVKAIPGVQGVKPYFASRVEKRYVREDDPFYYLRSEEIPAVPIAPGDLEIIEQLMIDGRMSVQALAASLGRGPSTVRRRVLWLLEQGVIRIGAVVNSSFLGYRAEALITLQVQPASRAEVIRALVRRPDVVIVASLLNDADIIFLIHAATPEALQAQLKVVMVQLAGVSDMQIAVRAEMKKRYYARFMADEQLLLDQIRQPPSESDHAAPDRSGAGCQVDVPCRSAG